MPSMNRFFDPYFGKRPYSCSSAVELEYIDKFGREYFTGPQPLIA
jgi:hypothetical protein